ncbi:MAG: hypothetical protein BWY74_02751 [Firmicutes bacterium ADurb.Bin419]|nr:MAG: hypothetical protein BWY74_02751 [Firmicutes bacterium ADurb.Bin419]
MCAFCKKQLSDSEKHNGVIILDDEEVEGIYLCEKHMRNYSEAVKADVAFICKQIFAKVLGFEGIKLIVDEVYNDNFGKVEE